MTTLTVNASQVLGESVSNGLVRLSSESVQATAGLTVLPEFEDRRLVNGKATFENVTPGRAIVQFFWGFNRSATVRVAVPSGETVDLSVLMLSEQDNTPDVVNHVAQFAGEAYSSADESVGAADRSEAAAARAEAAAREAASGIRDDTVTKQHLAPGLRDELDGKAASDAVAAVRQTAEVAVRGVDDLLRIVEPFPPGRVFFSPVTYWWPDYYNSTLVPPQPSKWDETLSYGDSLGYVILNKNSGHDWNAPVDTDFLVQGRMAISSGAKKVLFYVKTQYGAAGDPTSADYSGTPNAEVYTHEWIMDQLRHAKEKYAEIFDGVFLDEALNGWGWQEKYIPWYVELVRQIREEFGAHFQVVANPGSNVHPALLDLDIDCFMTFEGDAATYLDDPGGLIHPEAHAGQPSSRFWHVVHGVTQENYQEVFAQADGFGVSHVYVTDLFLDESGEGGQWDPLVNPYASPPSEWVRDLAVAWVKRFSQMWNELVDGRERLDRLTQALANTIASKADRDHTHTVEQITDIPEIRSAAAPNSLALRSGSGNILVASTPSGSTAATSQLYVQSYVASQMGSAGFTILPVEELPANPDPLTIYAVMGPEGVPPPTPLATYQMEGIPAAEQDFPGAASPTSAGWVSNPGGWYAGSSHGLTPPVAGIYTIKVTASPANGPVTIFPYVNGGWGTSTPGTGDTATATMHLTTSDAVYYDVTPITGGVPVTITIEAFAGEV